MDFKPGTKVRTEFGVGIVMSDAEAWELWHSYGWGPHYRHARPSPLRPGEVWVLLSCDYLPRRHAIATVERIVPKIIRALPDWF